MKKKLPYEVSDTYFENLKTRLQEVPSKHSRPVAWRYPVFAFAAAILLVLGIWLPLKQKPSVINITSTSQEDVIVDYLIDSGVTVAQLEDYINS